MITHGSQLLTSCSPWLPMSSSDSHIRGVPGLRVAIVAVKRVDEVRELYAEQISKGICY